MGADGIAFPRVPQLHRGVEALGEAHQHRVLHLGQVVTDMGLGQLAVAALDGAQDVPVLLSDAGGLLQCLKNVLCLAMPISVTRWRVYSV